MDIAEPVNRLVEQFKKLPGIGTKSAQRLAFFILKMDQADASELAETILEVKRSIRRCSTCNNLTDVDPCQFCTHPSRSDRVLCVVEESNSILPVEKTHEFKGRYHVLMGSISPLKGVSPDQLAIGSLLQRLQSGTVEEVIVATNPTVEGEATATYLSQHLKRVGVKVTRIAMGIPVGSDIEYTDEITMLKAMEGRRDM